MVRRVDDVGVFQLPQGLELVDDELDGGVDGLQGLQALGHEQVGELLVDGLHLLGDLQDPLLVGVGGVVVGGSAAKRGLCEFARWTGDLS